jgi:hypothetical protein
MSRKTAPAPSTVKRLAILSGNRCAFPKCATPLVDRDAGVVIGEVCHIKSLSPDGPRYDPTQTDGERNAFENLTVMCANHHTVIDADAESYTVERLIKIKADHESHAESMPDDLADRVATALSGAVIGGSVFISNHQSGGQFAQTITNIGTIARRLGPAAATDIADAIRPFAGEHARVDAVMGDTDSIALAHQLKDVVSGAGWTVQGVDQVIWDPPPEGVVLRGADRHLRLIVALGEALLRAGLRTAFAPDANASVITIIVGPELQGVG